MKYTCIKDVVMNDNTVSFYKGHIYEIKPEGDGFFTERNERYKPHSLSKEFMLIHFVRYEEIEELETKSNKNIRINLRRNWGNSCWRQRHEFHQGDN